MNDWMSALRRPSRTPLRIFGLLLLLAFGAEYGIMLLLAALPIDRSNWMREALIDSSMLTLVLAPAFWLVIVRPLQNLSASRGQLLTQLFDAQEQERGRVARDLHDELGQHLTAMLITIRAIEQAPDLDQARHRAQAAAAAGAASLHEVRRIARGLRPTVLDDLGLVPAIDRLCREFQDLLGTPLALSIGLDSACRFPPQIEMCVFRVLQESLNNATRHAGECRVTVSLSYADGLLRLVVADDGRGFQPGESAEASFGLHGMKERVELLDGRFRIHSSPGKGTAIRVELPAERELP